MKSDDEQWQKACNILSVKMNQAQFRQWIEPLTLLQQPLCEQKEGRLALAAPTKFLANWVSDHYGAVIKQAWGKVLEEEDEPATRIRLDILCQPSDKTAPTALAAARQVESPSFTYSEVVRQTPLNENMRFDNFVLGESNLIAYRTALSWSENYLHGKKSSIPSPLFICGAIGQGKTHLLHAMEAKISQEQKKPTNVMSLTAERFRSDFVRALQQGKMEAFEQAFHKVDLLLMDDMQFLAGKETQKEFSQLLNWLQERQGKVVMTATSAPTQLGGLGESLRSRLGGGLVVNIYSADGQLRQEIIRTKLKALVPPLQFTASLIQFLSDNITNNVRELEGAFNRIVANARHLGKMPDETQARLILRDLLQAPAKQISVSDIQKRTAEYFDISLNDLLSARRQRAIVRPRQIAMYLAKQLTPRSLPDIGRRFGGRDHTTVLHALRSIENLCHSNAQIQKDVANLKALCQSALLSQKSA